MDSNSPDHSRDRSDAKASFLKPPNDAVSRKYRRGSPVAQSDSSSSAGSPKREMSHNPVCPVNDRSKMSDFRLKDYARGLERESNHYQSRRGSDSCRYVDRSTYGNSHEYRRHNDYRQYERHTAEEERSYQRSSRPVRDSRGDTRYDSTTNDNSSDKCRDSWRGMEKHTRDRSESSVHRQMDRKDTTSPDRGKHKDKDSDKHRLKESEKVVSMRKQTNSSRDNFESGEPERHIDLNTRDDRKGRHRSPDYKNNHVSRDSIVGKDSDVLRSKKPNKDNEMDRKKEDMAQKRKYDMESDKRKDENTGELAEDIPYKSSTASSYRERGGHVGKFTDRPRFEDRNSSEKRLHLGRLDVDEKTSSSSEQVVKTSEIVTLNSTNQVEAGNGIDAAKVAAIKAAELVNKNLVGYLSTDQKKKLLWGGKKSTASEEPKNRWDKQLFSDREQQEKFKKLMGVKGEAVPGSKSDDKDAEKQRELLNMDLEKQYTAGLRRRDGRTVGLGL